MRSQILLLVLALSLMGCRGPGGKPHSEIVGQWKASEASGGDTWTFRADGTFTAEGGQQGNVTGSGAVIQKLPRTGRWGEKDGLLKLDYATLTAREKPSYQWKKEGGRLILTTPGEIAPAYVFDRLN